MQRLAVLTTGRQDWGILRSTCLRLQRMQDIGYSLFVGGMHCSHLFGNTADQIRQEGFEIAENLRWIPDEGEMPATVQAGEATRLVGDALVRRRPQALLLVGDRFETLAAGLAATLLRVALVHIHGGEETEGAFDNALRHALTKMSHLHLVSHTDHAARVIGMGEDPRMVHVVGAPGLDNLHRDDLPGPDELEQRLGLRLHKPVILVTHHPTTLGAEPQLEARAIAHAMDRVEGTYVITLPNADPGNAETRNVFLEAAARPGRVAVESLGERNYWGLLKVADGLLGNSSSALIEASALQVPAVNVGDRQKGRLRGSNILDEPPRVDSIVDGLHQILSSEFRDSLRATTSPYGDGRSAERIVDILKRWVPPQPPVKATGRAAT